MGPGAIGRTRPGGAATSVSKLELDAVRLFEGLTRAQLAELAPLLRPRRLAPNEAVVEAEAPGDAAFVIHAGFVRVQVTQANGEESILAIVGPGDVVGEMSLIDHLGRSPTVIAHEPATLLAIERTAFAALLRRMPPICFNLTRTLSRRLRLANAHIQALATLDVDGRIAHQLLAYAAEYGEPVQEGTRLPFRLTQSDLAALVGASRVRVNQVLVASKRLGYLSVDDRHRVTITDRDALARLLDGGGAPEPAVPASVQACKALDSGAPTRRLRSLRRHERGTEGEATGGDERRGKNLGRSDR